MIIKKRGIAITIALLIVIGGGYFGFQQIHQKIDQGAVKIKGVKRQDDKTQTGSGGPALETKGSPASENKGGSDSGTDSKDSLETKTTSGTPAKNIAAAVHTKPFLVVIDPGHQDKANLEKEPVGPGAAESKIKVSGGTTGVATGKPEYKLTLEASFILGKLLEEKGMKVIYTRTSDHVNLSNAERAEVANRNHADLFIRIHADGSNDRSVHGLSIQAPAQNDPYTKAIFANSLKASQLIITETKKNAAVKVNGIFYRSDLSGFNWSKVPATLIEMGYMTNPQEDRNLSDTAYLTRLMANIADGIADYAQAGK